MNYEELLASRNGASMKKDTMPFGEMYRKTVDGTYTNVIDLRKELLDSLRFTEALTAESQQNVTYSNRHQLHFKVVSDSCGLYGVNIEQGNFRTLSRLLEEQPAIVANKNFVEDMVSALADVTTYLNAQDVYHLCFAPSNVLVRKGDNTPLLLFHGSSYMLLNNQEMLYENCLDYVAPEVLEESTCDTRSEVYSVGRLLQTLYSESEVPLEYKSVIKKAVETNPDKRYQTVAEMKRAMSSRRSLRSSLIMGLIAVLLTLLGIYVFTEMMPEQENVEFIEPAPKDPEEDPFSDSYDPTAELGMPLDSSAARIDEQKLKEYEAKAEQIFRKRYAQEAERILSKIYDSEHMNVTEKKFLSESSSVMDELSKLQLKMGDEAGLSHARSQRIAGEIIERITNQKKAQIEKQQKESE